jgi:putative ABC transport system permease protein
MDRLFRKAPARPKLNLSAKKSKGKIMWRNYLIIATRSLAKNRLFTALNLVGLALGMASCLLIAMWVRNETTYDRWLPDVERIFVVQGKTQYPGKDMEIWGGSTAVMLPLLMQDFPQIEVGTRLIEASRAIRFGTRAENQPIFLVDAGFFDVLGIPLVEGSVEKALKQPDQIVVSERFARKWFGEASAVGQTLTVTVKGEKRPYQVAAVMRDTPSNSSMEFDVVMPLIENDFGDSARVMQWGNFSGHSIVKLKDANDAAQVDAGADAFIAKHAPQYVKVEDGFYYRPRLKNISTIHLQTPPASITRPPGDPRLVVSIGATGLLILIIATITYINLATARVSRRAREVGLRKTLGAERHQLMLQFLVESTLLASLAGVLALAIVELTLPAFNALLAQKLVVQYGGLQGVMLPLLVMVAFVGVIGGWYPALVLAKLRPREAISGSGTVAGGARLRQLLVIGQFGIAVLLMTCMAIIYTQISFMRAADMGYKPEGLIVVSQMQRAEVRTQQQSLVDAIRRVPGVTAVTQSRFDPTFRGLWQQQAFLPGVPDSQAPQISVQSVDWDYLKTYGGRLLAGRDLDQQFGNDNFPDKITPEDMVKRGGNILVNRAAMKFFNTSDPKAVVGKTFQVNAGEQGQRATFTIVGVIDNIRLRSARDEALPSYFARNVEGVGSITLRFQGVAPSEMTARLEAAWKQLFPDTPFQSKLVDAAVEGYYKNEARRGNLFALFAGIAIVLCAAGLYGLAVFTAERRTKEIGIRKVLGASVIDIVKLLVWQFSKPVIIATLIAWPLAWWFMREWLNGFNVRIALTPIPFLAAGVLAMVIAWFTVTWHAMRVARMSPIHALRHE